MTDTTEWQTRDFRTHRTLEVLRRMAQGEIVTIQPPGGMSYQIGMAEDMTIGIVHNGGILNITEMNVRELDEILTRAEFVPIPNDL